VFLRSLASGCGSFVKMASIVPDGFEVAVDSKLSSRCVMHDRKHINQFQVGMVALSFSCSSFSVGSVQSVRYDVIRSTPSGLP